MTPLKEWVERLGAALEDAHGALRAGDAGEADRLVKTAAGLIRTIREVAALQAQANEDAPLENVEDIRAELERRILQYVDADHDPPVLRDADPQPSAAAHSGLGILGS